MFGNLVLSIIPARTIRRSNHDSTTTGNASRFAGKISGKGYSMDLQKEYLLHQFNNDVVFGELSINNYGWVFGRGNSHYSITVLRNKIQ